MSRKADERAPWLVAVWPGMGQVALTAGYYLMAKLRMHAAQPLPAKDLFDAEFVQVEEGIVQRVRLPRNHVFRWEAPPGSRDIVVLIGEAQPPAGKLAFCDRILEYAEGLGVREVFTFAAMATDMHPRSPSRIMGVATHPEERERLRRSGVEILPDGQIAGLNGILLGAVAQRGLRGIGLLGEMPAFATQVPFPKASSGVLEVFARLARIEIDLGELEEYGRSMEDQLAEVLDRFQVAIKSEEGEEDEEPEEAPEPAPPEARAGPELPEPERRRLDRLFEEAARERSKAFELKRELDRLGVFRRYEDRFLDLFRRAG
jgi:hypothetical protein